MEDQWTGRAALKKVSEGKPGRVTVCESFCLFFAPYFKDTLNLPGNREEEKGRKI